MDEQIEAKKIKYQFTVSPDKQQEFNYQMVKLNALLGAGMVTVLNGYSDKTFQDIQERLKERLSKPGPIKTSHAWSICRHEHGYATVMNIFRDIMKQKVIEGKATKTRIGLWEIH